MSGSFDAQDEQTLQQQLKVQELTICGLDYSMYTVAPGSVGGTLNVSIYVNEPVVKVFNAYAKIDGSNTMQEFNQAEIAIIDSNLLSIASISAANPTIVTTTTPHFLYTKEQVAISGTNSTPILDGEQAVTVTGPYTFALPINVTIAGTAGSIDSDVPSNDYGVIELLGLNESSFHATDVIVVKYLTQPSKFYAQSLPTYNM